jgi:CheY-like chemotaxis protein
MNKKQHILIVDDCRTNLVLLKELLSEEYQVTSFINPQKALESFMSESYDFIISDLMMSEMTGIEFLQHVRQVNRCIPFVIITANTDEQNAEAAYQAGVNKYMYKPIDLGSLLNTVKNLVNKNIRCA